MALQITFIAFRVPNGERQRVEAEARGPSM